MSSKSITFTPEGAVCISYPDLISSPLELQASIEKAFGSDPSSLGIIVVTGLPPVYAELRERLLKLAYYFSELDNTTREKYTDASSRYSFGWSHGKEIMNGKPDFLKGSFYANPVIDAPSVFEQYRTSYPEYYGNNIWPDTEEPGVEGFEQAFKNLGQFVFKIGCELAAACQPFALKQFSNSNISLPTLISTSETTKARLLHYFPPSDDASVSHTEDEPIDSWCGFHLDHSLLTGLCSAMYLEKTDSATEPNVVPSPSPSSGLYIRTRGGDLTKVSIPVDSLAFQTGEALEVATGGKLRATPHCVRVGGSPGVGKVSRETFALFMQPNVDQQLSPDITFGQFSKRVFEEHYST
ncbi:Clavaminate synthase-like protein [Lentinula edodes]|uniref:Clavaminate synthase-like protein n=2 Tax=Lentinula TaxID=5352 RepID=A0A1Q3ERS3_LENED|nr:Clavaminate synthase-like protein [Lentinula edodes]GAW09872.1 Clavaminate synthase-like protein [Lentinula edodes]